MPVVLEHVPPAPLVLRPARHEEEVVRPELELTGLRVGLVDNDENQALGVFPGAGLVFAEFHDVLVALFRGTSNGSAQMPLGQLREAFVLLQKPHKPCPVLSQRVHDRPVGKGRVEPNVGLPAELGAPAHGVADEAKSPSRRRHVAATEHCMNETIADSAVTIIPARGETCHEGVIDAFLVVAVVGRALLESTSNNREAVDVDCPASDGVVSTGSAEVSSNPLRQSLTQCFTIAA